MSQLLEQSQPSKYAFVQRCAKFSQESASRSLYTFRRYRQVSYKRLSPHWLYFNADNSPYFSSFFFFSSSSVDRLYISEFDRVFHCLSDLRNGNFTRRMALRSRFPFSTVKFYCVPAKRSNDGYEYFILNRISLLFDAFCRIDVVDTFLRRLKVLRL